MMNMENFWTLARKSFQEWSKDNAAQLAAAIAFYTIFSIPPLLIISLAITGSILTTQTAQNQVMTQIGHFLGADTAEFVQSLVQDSSRSPDKPIASIISIVMLLAGASGVFYNVQIALNKIWDVPQKTDHKFRQTLINHFESFLMVLGVGFLLLLFLILSGVLSVLFRNLNNVGPMMLLPEVINFLISFGMVTVLIAMIYRVLPDQRIPWSDVWLGAAVTALLFMLGRYAIGFYLYISKSSSAFGAAGSLIVLLLWIYYSAQIFLLGAKFTHLYSLKLGSHQQQDAPQKVVSRNAAAHSRTNR